MKNINQILLVIVFLFIFSFTQAQSLEDALGFNETVNDVPEAPINFLIALGVIIGSFIGIKRLK